MSLVPLQGCTQQLVSSENQPQKVRIFFPSISTDHLLLQTWKPYGRQVLSPAKKFLLDEIPVAIAEATWASSKGVHFLHQTNPPSNPGRKSSVGGARIHAVAVAC